jgi:hypothetical protein
MLPNSPSHYDRLQKAAAKVKLFFGTANLFYKKSVFAG